MTDPLHTSGTRQRLLEAAGAVFAKEGYRSSTIREICRQAQVNVAAVNYHFRDKQHLYAAVLQYAHRYALETYPPDGGLSAASTAEARLEVFISSFLRRLLDKGRPAWHGKLMIREITEPTVALDDLVNESVRPMFEMLSTILTDLLGGTPHPWEVRLCASSIVGQCMHFQISREVLRRLSPGLVFDAATVEGITQHVMRFSLAGIRAVRDAKRGEP